MMQRIGISAAEPLCRNANAKINMQRDREISGIATL